MTKEKYYTVSLCVDGIEAENESDAIAQFENLVADGQFGPNSFEVELEARHKKE